MRERESAREWERAQERTKTFPSQKKKNESDSL